MLSSSRLSLRTCVATRAVPTPPVRTSRPVRRRLHVCRYREGEGESGSSPLEQQQKAKTDSGLNTQQREQVSNVQPGNISPVNANLRADLGNAATLAELQAFDGPIAESLNGRLAMLGVVIGLIEESATGRTLWQQLGAHPLRALAVVLVFGVATVVPVLRGYTRKEGFANTLGGLPWIPLAENWNGRLAMLGFAGMLFSEGVLHMNTLQAWGLQALH